MGRGLGFKCSLCGKKYEACPGVGFAYHQTFNDTQKAARCGEYGNEWKKLISDYKYNVVDAASYIYTCRKCGHWTVEKGLSIYEPKHKKDIQNSGETPYAAFCLFRKEYRILKRRIHKCEKCNGSMH